MTIEISKPELEKLVQEEILNGHFRNVDDLLTEALNALREKYQPPAAPIRPRENHFPAACPVAAIARQWRPIDRKSPSSQARDCSRTIHAADHRSTWLP